MTLEQLKLDDLTWTQMVTAIRRRIPAASDGLWTLHAPVDPGVTLLELYAYLLEQRLYWLDQTPDALVHAALSLMGERAGAAQPSATVMRLPPDNYTTLAPPIGLRLARRMPPVVFTSDEEVVLLPVRETGEPRREEYAVGLYIGGRDRALDLRHGRRVCLLPADGSAGEFRIVLPLTAPPPGGAAGKFFSLLIELDTPESIAPEWSHEAVADVPPPAQLAWSYRRAGTGERSPFEKVEDGTAGLRRSGVVRLTLPPDWTAETDLPAESYAIWVRAERATYSSPPVVKQVVPNTVIARHRRQTDPHEFAREWLPLPGSQISLPDFFTNPGGDSPPLQDHPALEDSFALSIRERDGDWHEWAATNAFTFHGPDERVFVVERELGTLRFGDGLTGRVPVPGKGIPPENVRLSYKVGGGAAGNHGRGLTFEGLTNSAFKARNVVAAEGGEETESLERARERAASTLRRVERAITASDHVQLLVSPPGVVSTLGVAFKRAHAELGRHPCHPCRRVPGAVTIYVVPDVPRTEEKDDCAFVAAPVPDPGALAAARARVERARLVASEVFVLPAVYREVSLAIQLVGDPVDAVALRETITRRMRDFLDPLVGGSDGTGWDFGEPLRPSALLREAQRAAGEDASVSSVGIGLDGAPPDEKCLDIRIESHELVVLGEVQISLRRAAAGQGGLR
jgi:hypothetical protein